MSTPRVTIYRGKDRRDYFLPYHLPTGKSGQFSVTTKRHEKGEKLTVVSMRNAIFMGLEPMSVLLDRPVYTHWLQEEGRAMWMSTMPQEVEQHERQLANFHGRVLIGGLGLGLAVALLENNPSVEEITVCELSMDVVALVGPHVQRRSNTVILQRDLYEHLRICRKTKKQYDCAFYDIWCPTGQSVLTQHVIPLRKLSVGVVPQGSIECWNEAEMIGQVRMSIQNTLTYYEQQPDKHPLLACDEKRFQSCKKAHAEQWAFTNWLRKERPSLNSAKLAADNFISALSDPVEFKKSWRQYA